MTDSQGFSPYSVGRKMRQQLTQYELAFTIPQFFSFVKGIVKISSIRQVRKTAGTDIIRPYKDFLFSRHCPAN